jgi:hypothetical protein
MQSKDSEEQKRNLIEKMGRRFEKEKDSSPLATKTHSTLPLNRRHGSTSEEPVSRLGARNSTSGTPLLNPFLIQKGTEYANKCGDRKRYFTISTSYITQKIERPFSRWQKEISFHRQVPSYKFLIIASLQNATAFFNEKAPEYLNSQECI